MADVLVNDVTLEGGVQLIQCNTIFVSVRAIPYFQLRGAQSNKITQVNEIMASAQQDIVVEKGSQFELNLEWWDEDDNPVDLSSWGGLFMLRERKDDDSYLMAGASPGDIVTNNQGEIGITKSAKITDDLPVTRAFYDLLMFPHTGASFTASCDIDVSAKTITATSGSPFSGLSAGDWVEVSGSVDNDLIYEIESLTSSQLTLKGTSPMPGTDELAVTLTFQPVDYPTSKRLIEGVALITDPASRF